MFVFCEICHEQRTSPQLEFYITSCSHIFCQKCTTVANKCPVCKKLCRTSALNKDLQPKVKEYFVNQTEQFSKMEKVYQFQFSKMDHFIDANLNVFEEFESRKQKIQKLKQMHEAYKKGIQEEQNLIIKLQQKKKEAIDGFETEHCTNPSESK